MTNESITAVIFDWDFTLVYTIGKNVSPDERTTMMLNQIGISRSLQAVQQAQQAQRKDAQNGKITLPVYPQAKPDFLLVYRDLLERLDVHEVNDELAYKLYTEYARLPTYLYEDVLPTLQALSRCGFRLGILSNHTISVRDAIQPLVGQFMLSEHIVISEEIGLHKPDPQVYAQIARQMLTPPEQCIYIGDNLNVDAIGAVQYGGFARGVWVDRKGIGQEQPFPARVLRIKQLTELLDLLPCEQRLSV
jgi:HAD superfamily hydrolase (TIGR01549 family)